MHRFKVSMIRPVSCSLACVEYKMWPGYTRDTNVYLRAAGLSCLGRERTHLYAAIVDYIGRRRQSVTRSDGPGASF